MHVYSLLFQIVAFCLTATSVTFMTSCMMKLMQEKGGANGLRWCGTSRAVGGFLGALTLRLVIYTLDPFQRRLPCTDI